MKTTDIRQASRMNRLHTIMRDAMRGIIPPATQNLPHAAKDEIDRLRDELCQRNMQIHALRAEVAAGLPYVDEVDISDSSDPQDADYVTPDDDIREQIRAELFDRHAEWINERACELVKAERQRLKDEADEARAFNDVEWLL